jgi:hypothetical protein
VKMPFGRRKHEPLDPGLRQLEAGIRELDNRFHKIEESLSRLSAKPQQIIIEQVHIHQPALEKLEFRLDGLDIEHLSGSLNLGNNFGAKTRSDSSKSPSPKGADPVPRSPNREEGKGVSAAQPCEDAGSGLQRTASGFRLKR